MEKVIESQEWQMFPYYVVFTIDCFAAPCFVVEVKHGLSENIGRNARHLLKGITLVNPEMRYGQQSFITK